MTSPEERDDLSKPNLLPYGIVPQAPTIQVPDVALFKKNKSQSVTKYFETKFQELQRAYQDLMTEVQINDLVYRARYSFIPIMGQAYYLYRVADNDYILSLIEPARWHKYEFLGAFKMKSTDVWEPVEE